MKAKADNMAIIYNPVDLSLFNPQINSDILRRELGIKKSSVIFLFLARIAKGNGALELVKSANKLTTQYPQFYFVLVGANDLSRNKYLDEVKNEINSKNIYLLPFRQDVPYLIASSDIIVIPFTEPHFARAGIEAAAMGKPSIGANIGGVLECIVDRYTGYLYNSIDEFEKYCIELGGDISKCIEIGKNALVFAKGFDADTSAMNILRIYERLL